jgi:hypothetical protein
MDFFLSYRSHAFKAASALIFDREGRDAMEKAE